MIWYYVHGFFIFLASFLLHGLFHPDLSIGPIVATILTGLLVISALRDKD